MAPLHLNTKYLESFIAPHEMEAAKAQRQHRRYERGGSQERDGRRVYQGEELQGRALSLQ